MAAAITVKQNKGSRGTGIVVVRSDATFTLAVNGAAPAANSIGETVDSFSVAEINWYGVSGATWTLTRNSQTLLVLTGSGHWDITDSQMKLEASTAEEEAPLVATLGGGAGHILVKVHKRSGE